MDKDRQKISMLEHHVEELKLQAQKEKAEVQKLIKEAKTKNLKESKVVVPKKQQAAAQIQVKTPQNTVGIQTETIQADHIGKQAELSKI